MAKHKPFVYYNQKKSKSQLQQWVNMIVAVTRKQPCHFGLEKKTFSLWQLKDDSLDSSWSNMYSLDPQIIMDDKLDTTTVLFLIFPVVLDLCYSSNNSKSLDVPKNQAGSAQQLLDCNFSKCTPPPRSYLVWSHLWLKVSRCFYQCKPFIIKVQSANISAASFGRPTLSFHLPLIS